LTLAHKWASNKVVFLIALLIVLWQQLKYLVKTIIFGKGDPYNDPSISYRATGLDDASAYLARTSAERLMQML